MNSSPKGGPALKSQADKRNGLPLLRNHSNTRVSPNSCKITPHAYQHVDGPTLIKNTQLRNRKQIFAVVVAIGIIIHDAGATVGSAIVAAIAGAAGIAKLSSEKGASLRL